MDTDMVWEQHMAQDDEKLIEALPACIEEAAKKVGTEVMFAVFAGWRAE